MMYAYIHTYIHTDRQTDTGHIHVSMWGSLRLTPTIIILGYFQPCHCSMSMPMITAAVDKLSIYLIFTVLLHPQIS